MGVREASLACAGLPVSAVDGVPPGYKQTQVGMIPETWEVFQLGELASLYQPTTISAKQLTDRGFPVYGANGVIGFFDSSNHESWQVIVTCRGSTCGTVNRTVDHCWITGNAMVINCDDNRSLSKEFFYHLLCNQDLSDCITGTGQPQIVRTPLAAFTVPVPPTKIEQEAIAEALSDADALIESLQQLIAKKRQIKQGTMQVLLTGQHRLPGFGDEWKGRRLDSIADIRSGGTPSTGRPELWDGDIPWCTPTDVTALRGSKYLRETTRRITQLGLSTSSAELIPAHSVVMTSRATIGECAINQVPVCTNQGFKNFIPFAETDAEFLYYLLQTKTEDFISLCGGSTFLEIGKKQLASFEVLFPEERPEQVAIAAVLGDMDAEIAAIENRLANARETKQGMMQALLTGAIRLPLDKAA